MELKYILLWYIIFLGFNFIGLAVAGKFFKKWFDKGFAVSKFIGFLAVTLPLWLLSSLQIVPFSQWSALIIYILLFIWSVFKLKKQGFKFERTMLNEEIIFLIVFMIWNVIRSTNPRIEGTEKFMNLAFMNSISRSSFFPPSDMWFSGGTINYYYIGHYMYTFVAKLGSIPMSFAYNLALNTIISYAFVSTYSIVRQLTKDSLKKASIIIALGAAIWLCFGGTIQYFYRVLEALINNVKFEYWFPEATRTIPFAINEFPAYSIVLGDLHGHYLGFPFIIMLIAFMYISFNLKFNSKAKVQLMLLLSVPVVALYGINSWDFISANFLILLVNFYQFVRFEGPVKEKIVTFIILETTLLLPGVLFMIPYFFNFHPAIGGLGIVPWNTERDLKEWLLMWGMFLIILVVALLSYVAILKAKKLKFRQEVKALIQENDNAIFATLLTIAALSLIIGVEIFYIKDLFDKENPPYFRTNTIFKFYFAAWPIFVIACSYYVNAIIRKIYHTPMAQGFLLLMANSSIYLMLLIMSFSYIFEAVGDFYPFLKFKNGDSFSIEALLKNESPLEFYGTMDGNDYIKTGYPEDYAMIDWFNQNVEDQAIIAEAVGDAYTYYSRISANTGLTAVIGWPTHEWQWRSNIAEINVRKDDIRNLYSTESDVTFFELLNKYNIKYVVVGGKEREIYEGLNEEKIDKICQQVFEEGSSRIYDCSYNLD